MYAGTSPVAAESIGEECEKFFTVNQIASMWNLSAVAVRRLFLFEPGVLVIGQREMHRRKRVYRILRIPESAVTRYGTSLQIMDSSVFIQKTGRWRDSPSRIRSSSTPASRLDEVIAARRWGLNRRPWRYLRCTYLRPSDPDDLVPLMAKQEANGPWPTFWLTILLPPISSQPGVGKVSGSSGRVPR
jgi:hypothetical protein